MAQQDIEDVGKIRRRLGLTQQQLAQIAGVSQSMIAKLESGAIDPSYSSVRKIFSALESLLDENKNKISEIMKEPPPIVSPEAGAEVVSNLLKFYPIVLVAKNGKISGVVTKSDLLARV